MCALLPTNVREGLDMLPTNVPERGVLRRRLNYAAALCMDDGATLDDLREAVTIYEDTEPIVRRVFGSAHPLTTKLEVELRDARAALRAREEKPSGGA